jgi:glucose-1-phosphate cytidylyltransferase
MKVVILAGGLGTRLSEYTESIPKPMVKIGTKPMIWHIMRRYAKFGYNNFIVALGYKSEFIKEYFLNYKALNSDFMIDMDTGEVHTHLADEVDWKVNLVSTGLETMTGGRLKRLADQLSGETFMLTYGDGIADIDIHDLVAFHKSHGKMVTMTAVRPTARFGELELNDSCVTSFREKPQLHEGWINGGFFVIEPEFLDLIANDSTLLEREPLETISQMGELMAYRHSGFWQCMDNKRDVETLETLWAQGAPWL